MNPYYYFYFKVYIFVKRINKQKEEGVEWSGMYALTVLVGSILGILYTKLLSLNTNNFNSGYKTGLIFIVIALFVFNYFIFIHKNKYKKIIKKYENETLTKKLIGGFFVIICILFTFLLMFLA